MFRVSFCDGCLVQINCSENKTYECSSEITSEMVIEKINKCIKDFNI